MLRDVEEADTGLVEHREDIGRVLLAPDPLVLEVVDLALRQAQADRQLALCRGDGGLDDLLVEADAVARAAAVLVGALVRVRRPELVEQVAVGAVDLNGVKARLERADGGGHERVLDRDQLVGGELAGRRVGALAAVERQHLTLRRHGRRGDRTLGVVRVAALVERAGVDELHADLRAGGMDGVDDELPGVALRVVGEAGLEVVALRVLLIDVGGLDDDQPEAAGRELGVVVGHLLRGTAVIRRADTRHRRHRQAVLQLERAERGGLEQDRRIGHLDLLGKCGRSTA